MDRMRGWMDYAHGWIDGWTNGGGSCIGPIVIIVVVILVLGVINRLFRR